MDGADDVGGSLIVLLILLTGLTVVLLGLAATATAQAIRRTRRRLPRIDLRAFEPVGIGSHRPATERAEVEGSR